MRVQAALERVHIGAASSRVALVSPSNNSRRRYEPQICYDLLAKHTHGGTSGVSFAEAEVSQHDWSSHALL